MDLYGVPVANPLLDMSLRIIGLYKIIILIRVFTSWLPLDRGSPWYRLVYNLSEPFLAPLRRRIQLIGMLDASPIAAWLILGIADELAKLLIR